MNLGQILSEAKGLLLMLAIVLILGLSFDWYRKYKFNKVMAEKARDDFGNRKYRNRNLKIISFFEDKNSPVDSITWNDMEMDKVFNSIDRSYSHMGSIALYNKLHSNTYSPEEDKIIDELLSNEKECIDLGLEFLKLQSIKDVSYLETIKEGVELLSWQKYKPLVYFMAFTPLYIVLLFYFFKLKALIPVGILTYLGYFLSIKMEKATLGRSKTFGYLRGVLEVSKAVIKSDLDLGEFQKDLRDKSQDVNRFLKRLRRNYAKTGSDSDFLYSMINILCQYESVVFFRAVKFINDNLKDLQEIYMLSAQCDMYIGLASLKKEMGEEITKASFGENISAVDLHNPILFFKGTSVGSTFKFKNSVLLTGSNASGKSTFLRTLGISQIMAMSLGFVIGKEFTTHRTDLITAVDISDSIEEGASYFVRETMAIKRMLEKKGCIFLLDEVFKGTNTVDRISAARALLKYISKDNFVMAATHDIELTYLLEKEFSNYHFEEQIVDGDIEFDFLIKEGPAVTRNAVAILELFGYPKEITEEAKDFSRELSSEKENILPKIKYF